MNIVVPDISFYQDDNTTLGGINFAQMKAAGAAGVIVRAGQNAWLDPDFKTNWAAAKAAGLPRGSYWFYDSRVEPARQANMWHAAMAGDYPELGLWADFEESYCGPYGEESHYKQFVLAVSVYFPKILLGVYTAWGWWNKTGRISDNAFWKAYPLWVANYGVSKPLLPKSWSDWLFWQYTASGDGALYGAESREIDLNYFNGDAASFAAFAGKVPQQEGQTMRYKAINLFDNMRLRSGSNTAANVIGTYTHGQTFEGDNLFVATARLSNSSGVFQEIGDKWLEVKAVNGVAKSGWVAVVHLGKEYCTLTDNNPPAVDEYFLHVKDGVTRKFVLSND